ncbi:MAG TPA: hypothetical protein VJV79_17140 [Polyangiaceae bacterium]|nr:hypothetical protein [Polyangiaceae bacterium]
MKSTLLLELVPKGSHLSRELGELWSNLARLEVKIRVDLGSFVAECLPKRHLATLKPPRQGLDLGLIKSMHSLGILR